jgi:cytochrome P450
MIEMKVLLAEIFRNFSIRSLKRVEDVKGVLGITVAPEGGVEVEITLRP